MTVIVAALAAAVVWLVVRVHVLSRLVREQARCLRRALEVIDARR